MNKTLKKVLIIVGAIVVLLAITFKFLQYKTKQASPAETLNYKNDVISINYGRPSKKGREIFGKLVPFGEVWRTGANEATTFHTKKDLTIGGKVLPAGHYTLWTVPGKETWTVIFNKKDYFWGVSSGSKASREPSEDALQVTVPAQINDNVVEKFEISFTEKPMFSMVLAWDKTKVVVPIME